MYKATIWSSVKEDDADGIIDPPSEQIIDILYLEQTNPTYQNIRKVEYKQN